MKHLSKYKELLLFFWKYGRSGTIQSGELKTHLELEEEPVQSSTLDEEAFIHDIQHLGPSFVKFGQLLSTRPDLISPQYIKVLATLQDSLEPFPYEEVEAIISDELGVRISKAFNWFEEEPIAAASLGQVHRAELRSGEEVVVKVQRPGIRQHVQEELEVLAQVASFLEKHTSAGATYSPTQLLGQFKKSLLRELDYQKEADNMALLADNMKEFSNIVIPTPVPDYTTSRVLTMSYLKGIKVTKISPLRKIEIHGEALCEELFNAYLKQIVTDGFLHADPHPGNVHLTEDSKIALLDVGMVAHLSEQLRESYLKLLLYIGEGKGDKVSDVLISICRKEPEADEHGFRADVNEMMSEYEDVAIDKINTGQVLFGFMQSAGEHGYQPAIELSMVGKALLNLDKAAFELAPHFNPNKAIRKRAMKLMNEHMVRQLKPQNFFGTLLESKELIEKLPSRLNKVLGNLAENEIRIKVDAVDERQLMKGFQKIANRITLGLILAALVVGSALLMRVSTEFTIFGYPGLAIISFLLAATGAGALAINIFFSDKD